MPKHVPVYKASSSSHPHHLLNLNLNLDLSLDLGASVVVTVADPFFTFLRSNLVLPPSTLNSTTSTPLLDASSSQTLPPLLFTSPLATMSSHDTHTISPSPSSEALIHPSPLDGIPPLTTSTISTEPAKIAALKLVADSIAQQRQFAARAIIFHPLTLFVYILLLGIISQFLYKTRGDLGILFTTAAGVTMACLVAVRGATGGYLALAEKLNWGFLGGEGGEEQDLIIGSRYGEELIGALVLRLEKGSGGGNGGGANGKKRSPSKAGKSGGNGVVRAWTVRNRYRGKGVGTELLEEAVNITREKLGNTAGVGFAAEHANSTMLLPTIFNAGFRNKERKASRMLAGIVDGASVSKKKR
ncbi:uncharacterized protein RCO7_00225 [Rhynchosporium graminicola]|uniref:N-acetyltransferase domain-containing protein n=1 Tax=Rhynchosporium graminicola TaxID=2792576 RepID=A0A1E1KHK7_9HELO|nr:uncharacterized protein RCO7_00225 [Rhynchosporium commune]